MEEEIKKLFGYNLKRIRKAKNISQMQLALKVDMHFTFINAIENGKKWVSPESISKFSIALGVEAYQFFLPQGFKINTDSSIEVFVEELDIALKSIKSHFGLSQN